MWDCFLIPCLCSVLFLVPCLFLGLFSDFLSIFSVISIPCLGVGHFYSLLMLNPVLGLPPYVWACFIIPYICLGLFYDSLPRCGPIILFPAYDWACFLVPGLNFLIPCLFFVLFSDSLHKFVHVS